MELRMNYRWTLPCALLLFSSCAASTATEKRFLIGDPAPSDSASDIFSGLLRHDYLQKEKTFKSNSQTVKVSTGVSVTFAPITKPLLTARAREKLNSPAPSDDKQCFETKIDYIDETPVAGTQPAQLDMRQWRAKLTHEGQSFDLPLQENPACKITKRTPQKTVSFGMARPPLMDEYSCRGITCAEAKIDLLKPFVIDLAAGYEPGLQPIKFEWIGIKESKIR
jgi:hypothetical protein